MHHVDDWPTIKVVLEDLIDVEAQIITGNNISYYIRYDYAQGMDQNLSDVKVLSNIVPSKWRCRFMLWGYWKSEQKT